MQKLLSCDRQHNPGYTPGATFGFTRDRHYDLLVVAPGWKPTKILPPDFGNVTLTAAHSYISGYEVEWDSKRIGWIQVAAGACNLIDHLSLCAELDFDKLVFIGAVGGLKQGFSVGDLCTPSFCIEGTMASAYLQENISAFKPFDQVYPADQPFVDSVLQHSNIPVKKASVFCTDSIFAEYYHLDFIKSFETDLIEMETSAFYRMAALLEKPAIALLVVSDNSANGEPLLCKSDVQEQRYNYGRKVLIPKLLKQLCNIIT